MWEYLAVPLSGLRMTASSWPNREFWDSSVSPLETKYHGDTALTDDDGVVQLVHNFRLS